MQSLTEEQVKDVQDRIKSSSEKVTELLKEAGLNIGGRIVKVEIAPGVYADTVQVGYTDTKYAPKPSAEAKDGKVELKED